MRRKYLSLLEDLSNQEFNWLDHDIEALLLDDNGSYEFDPEHATVADLVSNELAEGNGYARRTLIGKELETVAGQGRRNFLADPLRWDQFQAGTVAGLIVFRRLAIGDENTRLVCYYDDQFPYISNGNDLVIDWGPSGVFSLEANGVSGDEEESPS